jgi:hypothetical protein
MKIDVWRNLACAAISLMSVNLTAKAQAAEVNNYNDAKNVGEFLQVFNREIAVNTSWGHKPETTCWPMPDSDGKAHYCATSWVGKIQETGMLTFAAIYTYPNGNAMLVRCGSMPNSKEVRECFNDSGHIWTERWSKGTNRWDATFIQRDAWPKEDAKAPAAAPAAPSQTAPSSKTSI